MGLHVVKHRRDFTLPYDILHSSYESIRFEIYNQLEMNCLTGSHMVVEAEYQ